MTRESWYQGDWELVPPIGTMVKADYPITCLNPEEIFEVLEIKCDPVTRRFYVRGENTMWFGLSMIHPPEWVRNLDEQN